MGADTSDPHVTGGGGQGHGEEASGRLGAGEGVVGHGDECI